ncbi:MAG TPA: PQQ-binding-like beta-propeller repeat protein [Ktedonobacterales bacterium]|nr:PQQ-binding-like beta-propeller repeat protein [Ktedonobacterales bacterium]
MAGRQVFICAAAEDAGHYGELITALNAWEVPHTEMGVVPNPVVSMPPTIESEIRQCEVFLRVCTSHTRQSNAVKLATDFFQQALAKDRRGPNQRRRLVNLILDPAYLLDDEEKKTLYITAPGKSRPLWLEELSVSVGAATLTQQISRRALFGMGAGAAVAVASAGVAGTLLVQQFRSQQPPPLPVQQSISGNPKFNFNLIPEPMKKSAFDPARVLQDGATIYAQPVLSYDSFDKLTDVVDDTVYVLTTTNGQKRPIKIPPLAGYELNQSELIAATNGVLLFHNLSPDSIPLAPKQTTILRAVRASDSKQLWTITTALNGTPAIADGVLCLVLQDVTKDDGETIYYETSLNVFSMKDGARLWRNADYSVDTILTPAVSNGRLYIGSYFDQDHSVYCLDAKTGKKLWSYLTGGAVLGTPTVANGIVYVGSQDNTLYALDARTGALRWRFAGSLMFLAAPLIHDDVVYAPSQDGYIYALDARTGAMFWRGFAGAHPETDNVGFGTLTAQVAAYRNVLFAPNGNALYAFDLRHGSQRWQYSPVSDGSLTAPVISNGLVLVGAADNHVYAVNP